MSKIIYVFYNYRHEIVKNEFSDQANNFKSSKTNIYI